MALHSHPSLFKLLRRALERYPERIAFQDGDKAITYQQAAQLVASMQSAFAALGLGHGSRIALLSENRADTWLANMAAQGLGVTTSWLHPSGSLTAHIEQISNVGGAAVVIDVVGFATRPAELAVALPKVQLLCLGEATVGIDFLAMCRDRSSADLAEAAAGDHVATLNFTGGTTGRQRGVIKTNSQIGFTATTLTQELRIPENPRYLASAYISHVSGQLIVPVLLRGGTVFLSRGFNTREFCEIVKTHQINMTLMVPTMLYKLLAGVDPSKSKDLSSLQLVVYAGSVVVPSKLEEAIQRFGHVFEQIYAQSECTPIAILGAHDHKLDDLSSLSAAGYAVSGVELKIMDDRLMELPPGEVGEICVRSPMVMSGYLNDPEATRAALANGWLHTGDMGFLDDDGRLSIVDRLKDMIVSGGFNVYPREVEDVIAALPAIESVAVIGIPDEIWGEAVVAAVVLRNGQQLAEADIIAHVRLKKGPLLSPKKILFVDSLPQTVFGKIDKKALRMPFWASRERSV